MKLCFSKSALFLVFLALAGSAAAQTRRMPTPVPGSVVEPHGAEPTPRQPRAATWDTWGEARTRGLFLTHFVDDTDGSSLDQGEWMMSRLVAGARWVRDETLRAELELEALSGFAAGEDTQLGTALTDRPFPVPRDGRRDLDRVIPRKAYVAYTTPFGRFTAGTQTFLWGTGMLANDGATDNTFGDAWLGNVVARIGFSTRPLETQSQLPDLLRYTAVFTAMDAIVRDDNASFYDDDIAFAGLLGARALYDGHALGFLLIGRHQTDREDDYRPDDRRPRTTVAVLDLHGKTTLPLAPDQFLILEGEGAAVLGVSERPWSDATWDEDSDVRQFGGLARVRWAHDVLRLSAQVETGYASGDNDPRDETSRTFTMHTDHNVGLVLFDHVLPLLSARGADQLGDPALAAVAPPSTRFAINPGAVQNAIYINPVVRWRPLEPLDLRLGWLFAVPAADVIDPYQTAINGGYPTSYGGKVQKRGSYGHELDGRATWDFALPEATLARVGVEGGVLFPGSTFDDVANLRPISGGSDEIWLGRLLLSFLW